METHQKDIEEKDPFGQNRRAEDDEDDDEKSFLKALLAERALKNEAGKREVLEFKDSITENENVSFFETRSLVIQ